jgi:hypothetical protein
METNFNSEEITRLKGYFQQKYGFEVDDFTVSFLNEINEGFAKLKVISDESLTEIKEAANKIKVAKRQIIFQTSKVAFWYAIGTFVPFALTTIVGLFLFYAGFIYEKRHSKDSIKSLQNIEKKLQKTSKIKSKKAKLSHFVPK